MNNVVTSDRPSWERNKYSHIHYEIDKILESINIDLVNNFLELYNEDSLVLYTTPMKESLPWLGKTGISLDLVLAKDNKPNIILEHISTYQGDAIDNWNQNSSYDPIQKKYTIGNAKDNFIHYLKYIKEAKNIMEGKLRQQILLHKICLVANSMLSGIK